MSPKSIQVQLANRKAIETGCSHRVLTEGPWQHKGSLSPEQDGHAENRPFAQPW